MGRKGREREGVKGARNLWNTHQEGEVQGVTCPIVKTVPGFSALSVNQC